MPSPKTLDETSNDAEEEKRSSSTITTKATCTICGLQYEDKLEFNAHIRAHLKDKLTSRRNQRLNQEHNKAEGDLAASTASTASTLKITGKSYKSTTSVSKIALGQQKMTHQLQPLKNKAALKATNLNRVKEVTAAATPAASIITSKTININSLLPSSPLPLKESAKIYSCSPTARNNATVSSVMKPDLDSLINQLKTASKSNGNEVAPGGQLTSNNLAVMAELAACRPIPPTPQPRLIVSAALPQQQQPLPPPTSCSGIINAKAIPVAAVQTVTAVPTLAIVTNSNNPNGRTINLLRNGTPSVSVTSTASILRSPRITTTTGAAATASLVAEVKKEMEQPNPCTPEISDMEDELMSSYDVEMNRIDFHNDLDSILNTIETDLGSSGSGLRQDARLDTPPDSDCEANQMGINSHLLGSMDKFNAITTTTTVKQLSQEQSHNLTLVQSPASVAKVGKLPAKALALLNKLPSRFFMKGAASPTTSTSAKDLISSNSLACSSSFNTTARFVDVVKVERSSLPQGDLGLMSAQNQDSSQVIKAPTTASNQCIINIECRQPGKDGSEPAKIIQSFRAIDTGSEIKLLPADSTVPEVVVAPKEANNTVATNLKMTSDCTVCGKCITNKNMSRHLEKHKRQEAKKAAASTASTASTKIGNIVGDRKYVCKYCCKAFSTRSHLTRHAKAHTSTKGDLLTCRVCAKVCKNRVSLVRHRSKHMACVHCSCLFDNKIALQDHLLKAHPEKAIVSLIPMSPPPISLAQQSVSGSSSDGGGACGLVDFDDLGSIGSSANGPSSMEYCSFSPEDVGESLADIADANYFNCTDTTEITDDFYGTDIFAC